MTVAALPRRPDPELAARFTREALPHMDVLARGARRLTHCEADAEDLVQETMLRAYRGFHTFQEGTNIRAWLFRILHHHWINAHRARQCRPQEVAMEAGFGREAVGISAESIALEPLPRDDVAAALASLPEGFAEVLFYVFVEGYTYAETAEILDLPLGTVMSRISRGRKRLRIALAHHSTERADSADTLGIA